MTTASGSAADGFTLTDNWDQALYPRCNRNPDSYTQVNPNLVAGETTCVIIAAGQSTITNCGTSSSYTKTNSKIHMLNIYSGGMYSAINAMIGVDGAGENFLIRLADKMVTAGKYQRVILVPCGLGSTDIAKWRSGGFCNERLGVAGQRVKSMGLLQADQVYFIWQQGESDTALGTSQATYTAALDEVITSIRKVLDTTPIYISQTSWRAGTTSSAVRTAQSAAVDNPSGIYAGPDTDTLDSSNRIADNIHWNGTGSDAVAGLWNGVLA